MTVDSSLKRIRFHFCTVYSRRALHHLNRATRLDLVIKGIWTALRPWKPSRWAFLWMIFNETTHQTCISNVCASFIGCGSTEFIWIAYHWSLSPNFLSLPILGIFQQTLLNFHFWHNRFWIVQLTRYVPDRSGGLNIFRNITLYFVASCMWLMPMFFPTSYLTVESVAYNTTVDISICVGVQLLISILCIA